MELIEKLADHDFAPNFVARETISDAKLRIYVSSNDLRHAYGDDPAAAINYVQDVYEDWNAFPGVGHQYGIAFARGFGVRKVVDFHLYGDLDIGDNPVNWKNVGPSGRHIQTFEGGMVRDVDSHADNDIVLGTEEFHRRITPNFRYFIGNAALLGQIGLRVIQ